MNGTSGCRIHATAVVDPGAMLGANVSVGPFAYIERDVEIGDGCAIGPHVSVLGHTSIGRNTQVHAGAVLGDIPQDRAFKDSVSWVKIGASCVLREGVTVHRGTKPETSTVIGDDCFLMAFSHVGHNVTLGRGVTMANGVLLAGYVDVGDGAFISGNCVVHQFVRLGRLVMLGGESAVSKDVPPFCLCVPLTLNRVAGLNVVGMRRAGLGVEARREIKRAFSILYRAGLNTSQAIERLKVLFPSGPAAEFREFVERSKRGICGGSAPAGEAGPDTE